MEKLSIMATYIQGFFKGLWKYGLGIALLSLCYSLFLNFPLGQDVIIQAGEYPGRFIWAVASTVFFGFFCWYSYRLLSYEFEKANPDLPDGHRWAFDHFPRVLGYNVFLIIPLGVLGLPSLFAFNLLTENGEFISYRPWLLLFFLVLGNLYYVLLYRAFKDKGRMLKIAGSLIGVSYMLAWGWVWWEGSNSGQYQVHKASLPLLCMITFIFQVLFVIGLFARREGGAQNRIKQWKWLDDANSMLMSKIDPGKKALEGDFPLLFHLTAPIAFCAFVAAQFYASWAEEISALGIAFLGMAMIISSLNLLSFVSLRYRFSWIPLLVLVAIVFGTFMSRYQVRTLQAEQERDVRPVFNDYMNRWMSMHKNEIDAVKEGYYPVYFVISNGGASRSGFWAANVLTALEEESLVQNEGTDRFSRHILAMASASGGSLGHAVYYALLRENKPVAEMKEQVQKYFGSDFLSYTLGQLLGADIVRHVLPFIKGDRAVALEKALETSSEAEMVNKYMQLPLEQYYDQSGQLSFSTLPGYRMVARVWLARLFSTATDLM